MIRLSAEQGEQFAWIEAAAADAVAGPIGNGVILCLTVCQRRSRDG
ncbi:hypothetical protein [Streptomyces sp. NPDC097610]